MNLILPQKNMHPEQKQPWIDHASAKIKDQEAQIKQKEGDYAQTESAKTSRHDHLREDLAGELNTQYRLLAQQRRFLEELEKADLKYRVESGAFVDLTVNSQPLQILFMNTPGELPDIDVITPHSPIGRSIDGKIAGEKGSFEVVGSQRFEVEINFIL